MINALEGYARQQRLEQVRDEMENEHVRFSNCDTGSFNQLLEFLGITVRLFDWDMNELPINPGFAERPYIWHAAEVLSYPSICEYLHDIMPPYLFMSTGGLQVQIDYVLNGRPRLKVGQFDIFAFPTEYRGHGVSMCTEALCTLEIKRPTTIDSIPSYDKAVRQVGLQLISLFVRGNRNLPFGLLTDMEDIWTFIWIDNTGEIRTHLFGSIERGI